MRENLGTSCPLKKVRDRYTDEQIFEGCKEVNQGARKGLKVRGRDLRCEEGSKSARKGGRV